MRAKRCACFHNNRTGALGYSGNKNRNRPVYSKKMPWLLYILGEHVVCFSRWCACLRNRRSPVILESALCTICCMRTRCWRVKWCACLRNEWKGALFFCKLLYILYTIYSRRTRCKRGEVVRMFTQRVKKEKFLLL